MFIFANKWKKRSKFRGLKLLPQLKSLHVFKGCIKDWKAFSLWNPSHGGLNYIRLEGLILHFLSPVGAEILTRKFNEMDVETTEEDRNEFYQAFYGAFDDQSAAMDAILSGKEAFAHQAFKNVLDQFWGVNLDGTKPLAK